MNNKFIYQNANNVVYANGVFAVAYTLVLPEKYSMGEEDYVNLNNYWNNALKDLPVNSIFYKQDVFLKSKFDSSSFKNTNFLEKATKDYWKNTPYLSHECYLFFLLPSHEIINDSLINPFKRLNKTSFDAYDEKINSFIQSVKSVVLSLNSIKLQGNNKLIVKEMEFSFLKNYYDLYFNLFDATCVSDRFFNKDNVNVGGKYAAVLAMLDESKLPDVLNTVRKDKQLSNDKTVFFKNYGENFSFDLDFTHIYNQICIIDDNRKHLNDLRVRNEQLHKSSSFDKENVHFAKVTDEIITDIVENIDSIRMIRGHNNLIVVADSEDELYLNVLKAKEQFRDIDIKPYIPSGNYLNALFNNTFPFHAQYLTQNQLYIASLDIFCSFLNNTGEYKNDTQGIFFNSRVSNIPIKVDTWDEEKKYMDARNSMIFSGTGGGKSFTENHMIQSYLADRISVIIDLGGSYRKLAMLYPNQVKYITYQQGQSIGVNPFDLNGGVLDTDKIEELVEFVSIHYKRDENLKEIEKTSLRKLIEHYYLNVSENYTLPNFIAFIRDNDSLIKSLNIKEEFFNRDEFLHLMSEFVDNGIYSFLYKGVETAVNIENVRIVVFELDQIRDNKLLLTIMLQLVFNTIKVKIWNDKTTKGNVTFDEVAETLKWEGVLGRIEFYYQAIRKQGSAVKMILQDESQLPDTPTSRAIISNTQILYVLKADNVERLKERFSLSQHACYQIASLNSDFNAKVPYSEIFIKRGKTHQVYRLIVPKQVYWAFQTEGKKNEDLLDIYKKTENMENAINEYITLNP